MILVGDDSKSKRFFKKKKRLNEVRRRPIKYTLDAGLWFAFARKHYCVVCSGLLVVAYDSKVVRRNTTEAKDYDFSIGVGDYSYSGDVEFRIGYFKCEKCQKRFSFSEIKALEAHH